MEELQEVDVLWPETPPPGDHLPALLLLHGAATTVFSCGSFGEPAASSASRLTSTAALRLGRLSDGCISDSASTTASGLGDGVQAEEFQEADVLWPDVVETDTARDRLDDDVGEFWWLCRDFGDAGSHMEEEAVAAAAVTAGQLKLWRPLASSPIDIPTQVTAARRHQTAVLVHHRRR